MDDDLVRKARKRAEEKAGFYVHLGMYGVVNAFLAFLWWSTTAGTAFPWFLFPLFGWGIGLVAHFLSVFMETGFVDRMTEREMDRLRRQV